MLCTTVTRTLKNLLSVAGLEHVELQHFSSPGHPSSLLHACLEPWLPLLGQRPGFTAEEDRKILHFVDIPLKLFL